jgi:hypothetical protein
LYYRARLEHILLHRRGFRRLSLAYAALRGGTPAGANRGRSRLAHLRVTKFTRNAIDAFKTAINTIGVKYSRCDGRRKEPT